jgi:hypothetical protein
MLLQLAVETKNDEDDEDDEEEEEEENLYEMATNTNVQRIYESPDMDV